MCILVVLVTVLDTNDSHTQQDTPFFSEFCWGKAMVAYAMPQQRKKEESERLRGERDQIKFIDLGFERWQVVRFSLVGMSQLIYRFSQNQIVQTTLV